MQIKIKLLKEGFTPSFTREGDACLDCKAAIEYAYVTVMPHSRVLIPLGFAMEVPVGYEAQIRPRSGYTKKGIDLGWGTVDSNYRGEFNCQVINNTDNAFEIKKGDRVCQLAIRKTEDVSFLEVEELDNTVRGAKGFGSSGTK